MANYCSYCGSETVSGAKFCSSCGAAVESAYGTAYSNASVNGTGNYDAKVKRSNGSNIGKTVAAAAGVAVGASLLGNVLHRRRRPPMPPYGGMMGGMGHHGGPMGGRGHGPMGGPGGRR